MSSLPPKPDLSTTDVDYKGVVYGTQLAVHFMRQNPTPGGAIMATASVCGYHPIESLPEYSGAKAAVIAFARAVAPILKSVCRLSEQVQWLTVYRRRT
jgi:NAD(P)-dependent dehydrogenase (short-subunit alcohol dehydrogenase family)